MHKDTQKWALIDIAVLADHNIIRTEEEKVEKYQELAFEIRMIHGASKVTTIPIVIGALGSTSKGSKTWSGKLDVPDFLGSIQLSAILGTAQSVVSLSYRELLRHNKHYPLEHPTTGENRDILIY